MYVVPASTAENVMLVSPQVRMLGDNAACICYVRINQIIDKWVGYHMTVTWLTWLSWCSHDDHVTITRLSHDGHMMIMWLTWLSHDDIVYVMCFPIFPVVAILKQTTILYTIHIFTTKHLHYKDTRTTWTVFSLSTQEHLIWARVWVYCPPSPAGLVARRRQSTRRLASGRRKLAAGSVFICIPPRPSTQAIIHNIVTLVI